MKVVFFIDDVNMPARERYGAQPPIELLRQFQDFRGMYDRKQLFWRDIEDVTLCAACGPPGGGRQEVSARCALCCGVLCCAVHCSPTCVASSTWLALKLGLPELGANSSSALHIFTVLPVKVLPALHNVGCAATVRLGHQDDPVLYCQRLPGRVLS